MRHGASKVRFILRARASAIGYTLSKEGEDEQTEFPSIPQALQHLRATKAGETELVVMDLEGNPVAHFRV